MDIQAFHKSLQKHTPDRSVEVAEANEAFRNMAGLLDVLIRVNERTGLVPLNPPAASAPSHRRSERKGDRHAGE